MITTPRALSLAIAALGDCRRAVDKLDGDNRQLAEELLEATDHLTHLRDHENKTQTAFPPTSPQTHQERKTQ